MPLTKNQRQYQQRKERMAQDPEYAEKERARQRRNERAWYQRNVEKERVRNRNRMADLRRRHGSLRRRANVLGHLRMLEGCAQCGFKGHPAALVFHHVGAKRGAIRPGRTWAWLVEEMARCIVLCQNCHFVLHAQQKGLWHNSGKDK